jgi:hypothetical protein
MFASYLKSFVALLLAVGVAAKSEFILEENGIIKISCTDAVPNGVCERNGDVGKLVALPSSELLIEYGAGIICQCPSNAPADLITCDGTCSCKKCATDENDCSEPCSAGIKSAAELLSVVTGLAWLWFI